MVSPLLPFAEVVLMEPSNYTISDSRVPNNTFAYIRSSTKKDRRNSLPWFIVKTSNLRMELMLMMLSLALCAAREEASFLTTAISLRFVPPGSFISTSQSTKLLTAT